MCTQPACTLLETTVGFDSLFQNVLRQEIIIKNTVPFRTMLLASRESNWASMWILSLSLASNLIQWIEVTCTLGAFQQDCPFNYPKHLKSKGDKREYLLLPFSAWIPCVSHKEGGTLKWMWAIVGLNSGLKRFNHQTAWWKLMCSLQQL